MFIVLALDNLYYPKLDMAGILAHKITVRSLSCLERKVKETERPFAKITTARLWR
jgi:hypothetical protein